jgi:hypothetical protein
MSRTLRLGALFTALSVMTPTTLNAQDASLLKGARVRSRRPDDDGAGLGQVLNRTAESDEIVTRADNRNQISGGL